MYDNDNNHNHNHNHNHNYSHNFNFYFYYVSVFVAMLLQSHTFHSFMSLGLTFMSASGPQNSFFSFFPTHCSGHLQHSNLMSATHFPGPPKSLISFYKIQSQHPAQTFYHSSPINFINILRSLQCHVFYIYHFSECVFWPFSNHATINTFLIYFKFVCACSYE